MKRRQTPSNEVEAALEGDLHDHPGLRTLVEAARGPAQPYELTGLTAATAAFQSRAPHRVAGPRHASGSVAGRIAASALGVKIALACMGAAALGGLAYAGANGSLPGTSEKPAHPSLSASRATPTARDSGSGRAPGSTTAPVAALPGLCTSWLAAANDPNRATDHRFTKLVNAAGSAGAVTSYCTGVAASATHASTAHPSPFTHASPSAHPTPTAQPSRSGTPQNTKSPQGSMSPRDTKTARVTPPKPTPTHSGH